MAFKKVWKMSSESNNGKNAFTIRKVFTDPWIITFYCSLSAIGCSYICWRLRFHADISAFPLTWWGFFCSFLYQIVSSIVQFLCFGGLGEFSAVTGCVFCSHEGSNKAFITSGHCVWGKRRGKVTLDVTPLKIMQVRVVTVVDIKTECLLFPTVVVSSYFVVAVERSKRVLPILVPKLDNPLVGDCRIGNPIFVLKTSTEMSLFSLCIADLCSPLVQVLGPFQLPSDFPCYSLQGRPAFQNELIVVLRGLQ